MKTNAAVTNGADIYCFMRNGGNNHEPSWQAAYQFIKGKKQGLFKTSPKQAASLIVEEVVQDPVVTCDSLRVGTIAEAQQLAEDCGCDPANAHAMDGQFMVGHECTGNYQKYESKAICEAYGAKVEAGFTCVAETDCAEVGTCSEGDSTDRATCEGAGGTFTVGDSCQEGTWLDPNGNIMTTYRCL